MTLSSRKISLKTSALAASGAVAALSAGLFLFATPAEAHPHPERQPQGYLSHPANEDHHHGGMEKGFGIAEYKFVIRVPEGGSTTDPLTQCRVKFHKVDLSDQPHLSVTSHAGEELYPVYEGFVSARYEISGKQFEVRREAYDNDNNIATIAFEYLGGVETPNASE
jgi:hypothetical protein